MIDKALVDVWVKEPDVLHSHTVVDYIYLAAGSKIESVANVADIFITIGVCLLVVGIIYYMVVLFKKGDEEENTSSTLATPSIVNNEETNI